MCYVFFLNQAIQKGIKNKVKITSCPALKKTSLAIWISSLLVVHVCKQTYVSGSVRSAVTEVESGENNRIRASEPSCLPKA